MGTWASNGLESLDSLAGFITGEGDVLFGPYGIQVRAGDSIANKYFYLSLVKDLVTQDPSLQFPILAHGAYITATELQEDVSAWLTSAGYARTFVFADSTPERRAGAEAARGATTAQGFANIGNTDDGHFFVKPVLFLQSLTADHNAPQDGMLEYRSDTDVLRLYANGAWVTLATTADVDAAGASTMPVLVGTTSAQAVGIDLLRFSSTSPSSGTFPANDRAIAIPFVNTETITVVKMWAYNGAAVSGNIDIGIYTEAFAKVVSIGSTAQANTNVLQEFNIADTVLAPGRYYMVVAMDNTTGTLFRNATAVEEEKLLGMFQMASAFPLPTTLTPADVASAYLPQIGFSLRTLVA